MTSSSPRPQQVTQVQQNTLPAWVDAASQSNYELAKTIAAKPLNQYSGPTVAGTTQTTNDAYNYFKNTMGQGQGAVNSAIGGFNGVLGTNAPTISASKVNTNYNVNDVAAKNFTDYNIKEYMNPYTDEVVSKAMADFDRQRVSSLQDNASAASSAGAFGGGRAAVVDAVTSSENNRNAGNFAAGLRSDAFNNAAGLITGDANRGLTGAMANQQKDLATTQMGLSAAQGNQSADLSASQANLQAALSKMGMNINASNGLLGAASTGNNLRMSDYGGMLGIGAAQQGQNQAEIDANVSKFNEANNYDTDRLNLLLSSLGMSPYSTKSSSTQSTMGGSSGTDNSQIAMGVIQMLPLMMAMSDRGEKTDIKKLGKDKASGIQLYAYRYKGDPKTYPKVVGPMAQDLEKQFPGSTSKVAGRMVVPGLMEAYQ